MIMKMKELAEAVQVVRDAEWRRGRLLNRKGIEKALRKLGHEDRRVKALSQIIHTRRPQ
jgi:hypothetical protein